MSKSEINLEVPNKFFRDWLTEHYLIQIEDVLSSLAKDRVRVVFEINEKLESRSPGDRNVKKEEKERERPSRNTNLITKYTFDNRGFRLCKFLNCRMLSTCKSFRADDNTGSNPGPATKNQGGLNGPFPFLYSLHRTLLRLFFGESTTL
jgi:hypothetical protein